MDRNDLFILGAFGLFIIVVGKKIINVAFKDQLTKVLASFIPSVEGFRSTPYWDSKRYSWGYGTQAPGPNGTISREQAFTDMFAHLMNDYSTLAPKITRALTVNQWAAYLSFSYNEGPGAALKLVPDINAGGPQALYDHWMKYVYADGVVNDDLVERRNKEWELWQT